MDGLIATIVAYLVGSIPWGYLAGRTIKGIDLRTVGSGGTGATNVLRSLGASASAAVFALDFLKGLIPVVVARGIGLGNWWVAIVAVATVVGHCWSPFIDFKGGKGVATGAAAAIALFPATLLALPVMAIVVWRTRYVSLGSLVGAATAALLALISGLAGYLLWPSAVAILVIAAIIFIRHRSNIERLFSGSERRLGESLSV